jgi:hypothetical protein
MFKRRVLSSGHLSLGLAVATCVAVSLGSVVTAKAQIDPNIQSRIDVYTVPLVPSISSFEQFGGNAGACLTDANYVVILHRNNELSLPPDLAKLDNSPDLDQNKLVKFLSANPGLAAQILAEFFKSHPNGTQRAEEIRSNFFAAKVKAQKAGVASFDAKLKIAVAPTPTPFCKPSTSVKISAPMSPTYETNALKSSANGNRSPSESIGFGGLFQLVAPSLAPDQRPFDVMAFSGQSQSVRYDRIPSKSLDTAISQGAYQFFIDAFGFQRDGSSVPNIDGHTDKGNIPPVNMITVDTVALGFLNQTAFTPTYHAETTNLFTPQVTLSRQNQSLAGSTWCNVSIPDPRKIGFCYYADLSLTVGQTFSDVTTLQNANVAAAVTPGWRIPDTDLKLTLPATVTARAYEDVPGGRRDVLFQIGPAVSYTPPPLLDKSVTASLNFTLSATYNQNYSTIAADAWHGLVVLETITVALQPQLQ